MSFSSQLRVDAYASSMNVSQTRTFTGDQQASINQTIATGVTDQEILVSIDVSAVQLFVVRSTQDITIKTNDAATPPDTLTILANNPYVWADGDYNTFLLTTDVSKIFITNSSGQEATVQIYALTDLP